MSCVCPKDGRPCPDDVCRGSGICGITGTELWDLCTLCHQVYSLDHGIECGCEPDEPYEDFDDYDDFARGY